MLVATILPGWLTASLVLGLGGPTPATDSVLDPFPVRIDPAHSVISVSVRHFGFTRIRGTFNEWTGTVLWDEKDIANSSMTVVVKTGSVDTGFERRDNDLRSEDFFDAEAFPAAVFQSSRIEPVDDGFIAHGNLTIRQVTREIAIPFEFLGIRDFGNGARRIFASGTVKISRVDFDLARENRIARNLGVVSDEVEIELEIQGDASDVAVFPYNSREKPSIGEKLAEVVAMEGTDAAIRQFHSLREAAPDDYNFSSRELLLLANKLRASRETESAVAMATLAQEVGEPTVTGYLTIAVAYQLGGDHLRALEYYRKALELDEYDAMTMELLRQLEAEMGDGE